MLVRDGVIETPSESNRLSVLPLDESRMEPCAELEAASTGYKPVTSPSTLTRQNFRWSRAGQLHIRIPVLRANRFARMRRFLLGHLSRTRFTHAAVTDWATTFNSGAPAGNLTRVSSLPKMRSDTELQGLEPNDRIELSSGRYECPILPLK